MYGKIEVMMALLDRGADINARSDYQNPPLNTYELQFCDKQNVYLGQVLPDYLIYPVSTPDALQNYLPIPNPAYCQKQLRFPGNN